MNGYFFYILIWIISFNNNGTPDILKKEKTCVSCHSTYINNEFVHAPAADDCASCHQSNGNKHPHKKKIGFGLSSKVPELCQMCHDSYSKQNIHAPAGSGECMTCHSPHSTKNHSLIKEDITSNLCFQCHDNPSPPKEIEHKPVRDGRCESCHDPHQSDNSKFLKSAVPDLCYTCHENTQKLQTAENVHPPFADECATCHKTHSSVQNNLLTEKVPDLCYMCHDGVRESFEASKSVHKVINSKKSCAGCHSPHGSAYGKFLYAEGKELCLRCHNRTIRTENGLIPNIKGMLKETNTIHPVIEDGCVVCHMPHAADYPKLLNAAFPQETYVKAEVSTFELCFGCHDSGLLTEEKSEISTNFRDGDRNLHFVHINGHKARNCNVCHNVHGSPNEHLITQRTTFGNWEMPLRVGFNPDGGSCNTGCHAEKHYNRVKAGLIVENIVVEEKIDDPINDITNNTNFNPNDWKIVDYSEKKDSNIVKDSDIVDDENNTDNVSFLDQISDNNDDDDIEISDDFVKLNSIKFDFDTTKISNDIKRDIENIVKQMKNNPQMKVEIEGYTDNVGEEEYNRKLSLRRANKVKEYLIEYGISADRITTSGYGEANPITSNDTKRGRMINRRVEFVFYFNR